MVALVSVVRWSPEGMYHSPSPTLVSYRFVRLCPLCPLFVLSPLALLFGLPQGSRVPWGALGLPQIAVEILFALWLLCRACRSGIVGSGRARFVLSLLALAAPASVARVAPRRPLLLALVAPASAALAVPFRFLPAPVAQALLAVRAAKLVAPRPMLLASRPVQVFIRPRWLSLPCAQVVLTAPGIPKGKPLAPEEPN